MTCVSRAWGRKFFINKEQPGRRRIKYRHYLPELAHKPQATRQVAPQLTEELGEPFGQLWEILVAKYGGREAGRVLSRLLGAIVEDGEATVKQALQRVLESHQSPPLSSDEDVDGAVLVERVAVPEALRGYEVEAGSASDYDWLLMGGVQ